MIQLIIAAGLLTLCAFLRYSPVRYHKKKVIGKYPLPKNEAIKAKLTASPDEPIIAKAPFTEEGTWMQYIKEQRNSPTN